jgi:phage regulator Rha-like protein
MNLISNNIIDSKIIELRDKFIIIDRDVAELYGVETKRVNEAVSNNIDKFPKDYMFELTKDEKSKVVEYFDHLETIKYSPYLPKAFTKKGLWMLATILSSKKAKEVTFLIIETFEKIDNLKYNLKQLETTTDNKFPKDYMFELTKDEKSKVVEYFDHLETIKYSPYLPKAFTKKGLWMLATILSSKKAKEVTFLIIETFEKIDNLKYNLKQLETTTDNKLKEQLSQKSGEIIAELLEVPEEYDADTETSIEVNFGLLKYKRTVKKVHKKEN